MTDDRMTVDELARRAGTTTRNVRAYQTRGLLPPPAVIGRVGYYDAGHLARLNYIGRLQDRGFSLAAIAELLDGWQEGKSLSEVLGFEEALYAPWSDEKPERFTRAELEQMFTEVAEDDSLLERSVAAGILRPLGDDLQEFEAPRPSLVRAGAELAALGVPLAASLAHHVLLMADMDRIARRMVELFETYVWEPFVAGGMRAEELPRVTSALERVRPVAFAAVQASLATAMERAVTESAERQVARLMSAHERDEPPANGSSSKPSGTGV